MANNNPRVLQPVAVPRPEDVLAERYDQLCAWAVRLTRGDTNVALDVVHDLYLYVTLAKPDFSHVENIDNYLYKCLRHIHLAHLAACSRSALRQVSVTDLDSLQLVLWAAPDSYVLEHQNELRQICRYAVWRKDHIKSASFFVLRFFHGYHLREISDFVNLSMEVLQPKLSRMRAEIQSYLEQPEDPQFAAAPSQELPWIPVSSPELFRELRATILHERNGDCLPENELLAYYSGPVPRAIPCPLLSHIVSCEHCLSVIDRHFRRPTLRDREPLDGLASSARRTFQKAGASMSPSGHKEMLQIVLRHRRDVYEHRPRLLSIAADGKIIATHRIKAQTSSQSARIEHPEQFGCVEVFSEQDIRLALVLLENLPPHGPATRIEHIELSDGRWIEVALNFDSLGLNSEVTYFDPLLPAEATESAYEDECTVLPIRIVAVVPGEECEIQDRDSVPPSSSEHAEAQPYRPVRSRPFAAWWSSLYSRVRRMSLLDINPLLAGATILALASLACFVAWMHNRPQISPSALLNRAAKWDTGIPGDNQPGVIYQKVQITAAKRTFARAIYRDVQGHRRPKQRQLSPEDEQLRSRLEAAGVSWDAPLSASTYQNWHDHQRNERDRITRAGQNLLRLTTTTAALDSLVIQETLTVRENDFHPVDRTVELRDYGTVEIAELNYDVLPWSMANPDWFEQPAANAEVRLPRPVAHPAFHLPPHLTDAQLDEAELEARLVLNRLHVDMGRRIDMTRGEDGIHVFGIVDSSDEKQQIQSQLVLVPHVIPMISTVQELNGRTSANGISSVQAQSVVVSESTSSIERYFTETGLERNAALSLTEQVVDGAFLVNHESKAINDLWQRFGNNDSLTPDARMALSELLIQHKATLLAALQQEQQRLIDLKLIAGAPLAAASVQGPGTELEAAAQRNFALVVELTSPGAVEPRPAQQIAPQIAESISRLRAIVLRISAASLISPPSLNQAISETQNK